MIHESSLTKAGLCSVSANHMKAVRLIFLYIVCAFTIAPIGATERQPIPRAEMIAKLLKDLETSETVAIVTVSTEPTRVRLEVSDLLYYESDTLAEGSTSETPRPQPNDGAHPSFTALAFFRDDSLQFADATIYPLTGDRLAATSNVSIDDVKDLIYGSQKNQIGVATRITLHPTNDAKRMPTGTEVISALGSTLRSRGYILGSESKSKMVRQFCDDSKAAAAMGGGDFVCEVWWHSFKPDFPERGFTQVTLLKKADGFSVRFIGTENHKITTDSHAVLQFLDATFPELKKSVEPPRLLLDR